MKISKQARREAKQLFRSCVVKGSLDGNRARDAVKRVADAKPRGYLAILTHFVRLLKLEMERRTARIESTKPLAPQMTEELKARLTRHYGEGLEFDFATNPALIGGVRVKVGSDVYDGSIQQRLAALQEAFSRRET